jgi:hypothetical protein
MTYVLYARYETLTPELLMVQFLRGVRLYVVPGVSKGSSAFKCNVLFWVIMQRVVIISYRPYSLRNNSEERCSQLLRGRNLK